MSGLDQAFIKAYAKDRAAPGLSAPHMPLPPAAPDLTASVWSPTVVHPAQPSISRPVLPPGGGNAWGATASARETYAPSLAPPRAWQNSPGEADHGGAGLETPVAPLNLSLDAPHEPMLAGPHWNRAQAPRSYRHQAELGIALSRPGGTTSRLDLMPKHWDRPAFEVDHFQWPAVVTELVTHKGAELDATAHRLVTGARAGQKVIAVGGAARGVGSTTLLICLAQRLAAMRLKAALVDADFAEPRLAQRLGLDPQFGWHDIRDHELSLSEVMIESLDDGLSLLPLQKPIIDAGRMAAEFCWPATIHALRERYQLVLIDAGPLHSTTDEMPPWLRGNWGIDAVLVVGDASDEGPNRLSESVERLLRRGLGIVGVAENFCPDEAVRKN